MAYELSTESKLRINQVSATGIAVLKDAELCHARRPLMLHECSQSFLAWSTGLY